MRWYGLMYLAGFVLGWLGVRYRARLSGSPVELARAEDLVFYVALGVIVGGRLGSMLFYDLSRLIVEPAALFRVWEGGMSFHGGLIGVLVAMWLFARRIDQPFFAVADFVAPWVPIGLGLGRVGNFINGELWGKATSPDAPWAVIVEGIPRHPSQLYEAFLEGVVLFAVLFVFSAKPRPVMAVSGLFLALYGVFRIAVEFVRLPDDHIGYLALGWLTMGHALSAPMVIAGVLLLVMAYRRKPAETATA